MSPVGSEHIVLPAEMAHPCEVDTGHGDRGPVGAHAPDGWRRVRHRREPGLGGSRSPRRIDERVWAEARNREGLQGPGTEIEKRDAAGGGVGVKQPLSVW